MTSYPGRSDMPGFGRTGCVLRVTVIPADKNTFKACVVRPNRNSIGSLGIPRTQTLHLQRAWLYSTYREGLRSPRTPTTNVAPHSRYTRVRCVTLGVHSAFFVLLTRIAIRNSMYHASPGVPGKEHGVSLSQGAITDGQSLVFVFCQSWLKIFRSYRPQPSPRQ